MVLSEEEKRLIVAIRQSICNGHDVEVREGKDGALKILKVKKQVVR